MNRKLVGAALLVLLLGLLAIPMASAQFGGGDAGNNDGDSDSSSEEDDDSGSDSDSSSDDSSTDEETTDDSSDEDTSDSQDTEDSDDSTDDSSFDGGDSENNDDETSEESDYDGGDSENNEEETEFDGGDSESNDEDESSTDDEFDGGDSENNEEETEFDGGDAENNEEETEFDGGDSENNEEETEFDGGDAENNEETEEDETTDSDEEEADDEETTEDPTDSDEEEADDGTDEDEETTDDDDSEEVQDPDDEEDAEEEETRRSSGGGRSVRTHYLETDDRDLEAEINPKTIQIGESAVVSGTLTGDNNANQEIEILLNGDSTASTTTGSNGEFEAEITPSEVGDNEVTVRANNEETSLSIRVTPTVSIHSMHTSLDDAPGSMIDVCADIRSQTDATVTLYHNDQEHDTKTGQNEVCFRPTLEDGENVFRVVATVEGDQDEREITRNSFSDRWPQADPLPATGGFFSSTASSILTGIALIVGLLALIARRRGIRPLSLLNS